MGLFDNIKSYRGITLAKKPTTPPIGPEPFDYNNMKVEGFEAPSFGETAPKKSFNNIGGGTQKSFTSEGSTENLIPRTVNPNAIAKTAVSAGTALGALGAINKANRVQQGRTMRSLTPIQTSVASVQDLPSEVLAQRQGQISRLRSTYRGSDPSMKLISDLTAGAHRTGLREQLAGERGANLIEERKRVAGEHAANQLRAGETAQENIKRQQELDDYKLEAEVNKINHQNKLLSQVGGAVIGNIEDAEAMNIRGEQVDRENALASIDTNLQHLNNMKEEAIRKGYDPTTLTNINNDIASLIEERNRQQTRGTQRLFRTPSQNMFATNIPTIKDYNIYTSGAKLLPRE